MKNKSRIFLLALSSLLSVSACAATDSFLLRQGLAGYTGTADTIIVPAQGDTNYGAYPSMLVGHQGANERRALLRFDMDRLKGQKAKSATLTLSQVNVGAFKSGQFTISLFALAAGNADWKEGRGQGKAVAQPGEATWNAKGAGQPVAAWAGSAGLSTELADVQVPAVATFVYDAANDGGKVVVDLPVELVQTWIDNPGANGGLLLRRTAGRGAAMGAFRSSEYSDAALRPQLEVVVE